ncbi:MULTISPECIES: hypothetical protein [unclassified Sphingomonas]|uniref:hypothetical protein n=1 Tax=unclassified Sphingomonas TaxID=196159 RepID=UPI000700A29B|nr:MULTISPECIES: hypothetical protein [unclassified Sphingomonas]KQM62394.1 hypothetical protein ASE65_05255 [Sphingomonas sp. Leaf16]KQN13797.1 hypothetical protein ASE81_05325 [Sphingomonas sp. Leaf29]KQN22974.1 hypothetical protein ASE83_00085 [Sphingomonas sp. Leaf32]
MTTTTDMQGQAAANVMEARERERPSQHGAILGETLIALEQAGRNAGEPLPDPCLTCAFRPGMSNQQAATGIEALNCSIGGDPAPFGCHHGMQEGQPTRLCAGYLAAKRAPFGQMKALLGDLAVRLEAVGGDDPVRAAFDAWRHEVDPGQTMDDYQLARLYARRDYAPIVQREVG